MSLYLLVELGNGLSHFFCLLKQWTIHLTRSWNKTMKQWPKLSICNLETKIKISLPSHPYWSHNSKRNIQTPRPLTSPHSRTLTPVPEQWTMQPPISEHPFHTLNNHPPPSSTNTVSLATSRYLGKQTKPRLKKQTKKKLLTYKNKFQVLVLTGNSNQK